MLSLIISSIISFFIAKAFFYAFIIGFVSSYYLKLSFLRTMLIIIISSLTFESIFYQIKEFSLNEFYFRFPIYLILGMVGYKIENPLFFSSFFYSSYLLKIFWNFVVIPIIMLFLYFLNLNILQKILLFITFFFFSIPFISYAFNYYRDPKSPYEVLSSINGILLGYIFLKNTLSFVIFTIFYIVLSFSPHKNIFSIFPNYFARLFFYLFNALMLVIPIYLFYNPQYISILKYPLLALGVISLHILQILIPFIPGHFVPFTAGYLFGIWGILVDGIGMLLGSFGAYYLSKIYGRSLVLKFIKEEDLEKFSRFVNERGILGFYLLYLIPFTPKDALCFVAGIIGIKSIHFLLLVLFIRIPADSVIVLMGAGFKHLDPKISLYITLIGFAFILAYFIISSILKYLRRVKI
ncbi:MAG: VTT domain-containing protein [candidate division WOR-3 bacterium]|nr:VTT domain-containing protein [candidate division WOR-3 bacterium]MCX7948061.1 VTT domain-containing protein [candidate division WOR-3 bacterium]MDW8151001.1 VTT domain-containing protein [candidate division WOR-3 bacterium]